MCILYVYRQCMWMRCVVHAQPVCMRKLMTLWELFVPQAFASPLGGIYTLGGSSCLFRKVVDQRISIHLHIRISWEALKENQSQGPPQTSSIRICSEAQSLACDIN